MSAAPASILFVLVLVVFGLCGEYGTFSCHFIACQILIVGSDLVYQAAIRQDLDDTVGSGLYELVVMAGEQCYTGELDQTVVQRSDGLHIQMVGGLIQDCLLYTSDAADE